MLVFSAIQELRQESRSSRGGKAVQTENEGSPTAEERSNNLTKTKLISKGFSGTVIKMEGKKREKVVKII